MLRFREMNVDDDTPTYTRSVVHGQIIAVFCQRIHTQPNTRTYLLATVFQIKAYTSDPLELLEVLKESI